MLSLRRYSGAQLATATSKVFLSHQDLGSGSNLHLECLFRTLDILHGERLRRGRPWFRQLRIQADNAVAGVKNAYVNKMLALTTPYRAVDLVGVSHLRVGHAHEDIDSLFGLVALGGPAQLSRLHNCHDCQVALASLSRLLRSMLVSETSLQDPQDVVQ